MITVLFDGKCGLCRREIRFYQKIAPLDRFRWVDVTDDEATLTALHIRLQDALREIHVFDDLGTCHKGAEAFATIWKALPGFRWLGQLVSLPIVKPLARWAYWAFGALRYRLYGYHKCEI